MIESGYYPPGAENDPRAPYNQCEPKPIDIKVRVTLTMAKEFTIEVDDYIVDIDEEHDPIIDTSNCNLEEAVKEQILFPNELPECIINIFDQDLDLKRAKMPYCLKKALKECENWNINELEIEEV